MTGTIIMPPLLDAGGIVFFRIIHPSVQWACYFEVHRRIGLKFGMVMNLDHLWEWLDFDHSLSFFLMNVGKALCFGDVSTSVYPSE